MSKAFDRVNHATLMLRFCEVISDPRDIAWTLDYLHGRTQRVFANNTHSQWTHITSGVPQGGGEAVPVVPTARYLGWHIDSSLSHSYQVQDMVLKASKRLYLLRVLARTSMSADDLLLIYSALIRSVLEYGHVLLVGCSKGQEEELERVQRRALKIISRRGIRPLPHLPSLKERSCNHPAETNDESIPPTS
ncbi:hypothetical protein SKAU_G00233870 [Synaphobranchus kaupii]|uniref:Reverse transcriptase n=1 Tax=Synaphobranchus kaupii TaxID=118154 RepID=A0A9Q1ITM7_SYNKA|nr:hypothetical protein SKAU_G00233870 [Synaphobranchus kaupii]